MIGETVWIIRRTTTVNRYGDVVPDDVTARIEVRGAAFDPGGSVENMVGRDSVTTTPTLYLPPDAAVPASADSVEVRGEEYRVEGATAVWVDPFSGVAVGTVVPLKAVNG